MRRTAVVILTLGIVLCRPVAAKVYKYIDDKGYTCFTNDLYMVPEKKRPAVIEHKENSITHTSPVINKTVERTPVIQSQSPSATNPQKKYLKAEYQELIYEKEFLDNNRSFQKRRIKKKYKHRPQITKLLRKEQQIIERLAEIIDRLQEIEEELKVSK